MPSINRYLSWALAVTIGLGIVTAPLVPVIASGIQAFAIVPAGGTGRTTLTAHAILIGSATSPVNFVSPVGTGNCLLDNGVSSDPHFTTCPAGAAQLHSITFAISGGGSAITTGDVHSYPTAAFTCTINRVDISGQPSGSATVDIWKAAGAIPTSGNKISASAPATLSSSQLAQNGSLTGWTTSVTSGDVFGANVATATTVTSLTVQVWCQ